eukprot:snap_masked-scaffold18_size714446-processed-gene-6.27 protein:Tk08501 transcript:snap_masked-scaffold18_size714446-processed-gene-6.27-mRNA-1 annotation:"exosome complex component rrp46"
MSENQLRPVWAQLGLLGHTDGSVMLSMGRSAVMCGVYGPAEVKPHKEKLEGATVEVQWRPPTGASGLAERALESVLRGLVSSSVLTSLHPRTCVHVSLQPLDRDGGELASAVNAACLALIDASVAMRCLFAAVQVARDPAGRLLVDPCRKQLRTATASATFVFESVQSDVLATHLEGRWPEQAFQEGLQLASAGAQHLFQFYRDTVQRKYSKDLAQ